MLDLDLTKYHKHLRLSEKDGKKYIYDPIRKKSYLLQPEEFVRQIWIAYLHEELGIAHATLGVEKTINSNGVKRRYDLVHYKRGIPYVLFEFKSHTQNIDDSTALQAAHYNQVLQVPFIVLSNGPKTYAFKIDFENNKVVEIAEFPLS